LKRREIHEGRRGSSKKCISRDKSHEIGTSVDGDVDDDAHTCCKNSRRSGFRRTIHLFLLFYLFLPKHLTRKTYSDLCRSRCVVVFIPLCSALSLLNPSTAQHMESNPDTVQTDPTPMDVDEVKVGVAAAAAAANAAATTTDSNGGVAKDDNDDNDDDTYNDDSVDDEIDDILNDGDDDDDDDDDIFPNQDGDEKTKKEKNKEDPEILLIKAQTCKEEGNEYFTKEKDYEKASRAYRRGVNAIKGLNKANSGDDQVKALLLSLQTNLSMMSFKLQKYKQSETVASNALTIDPKHVKSLYRRAAARRKLGDPEGAREDLKLALVEEPNNTTVRKELVALKKELEDAKRTQKLSLQKAFSKGGGLLYDDKLEEEKKKAALEKEKKKEEEEALKKRKVEWEDECVKRMAKGEEVISFEDWDKARLDRVKKEQEEANKKRKEEEKRRKEERKKAKEAAKQAKGDDDDDSDVEMTEQELAQMRGYKKTADGRTTSYFTREQSDGEKSLIGDIAPKPISFGSSATGSSTNSASPQPITPSSSGEPVSGGKGRSSAWNHAGTWYVL
jgi:hypothetical protein